jgi:hypothetical protein
MKLLCAGSSEDSKRVVCFALLVSAAIWLRPGMVSYAAGREVKGWDQSTHHTDSTAAATAVSSAADSTPPPSSMKKGRLVEAVTVRTLGSSPSTLTMRANTSLPNVVIGVFCCCPVIVKC